jgi:hypothetical protein
MAADTTGSGDLQGAKRRSETVEEKFRRIGIWSLLIFMIVVLSCIFYDFVQYGHVDELWMPLARDHFAAVVGLPMCALGSLCVVLTLRISAGPMEVEAWGLKFKGAAAPIVFWLLCFLAMATMIKMLWHL